MFDRNEVSEIRERFTGAGGKAVLQPSRERWGRAFGAFAVLFVAAVAAGVLLTGCGSQAGSGTPAASVQAVTPQAATPAQAASMPGKPAAAQVGLPAGDRAVREGLPPDLSVSVGDTLVDPGQVVDFTVQGTTDVAEVTLSDGRDDPMGFVHDETGDVWRAQYRVPLHPRHERFGVSVTAKNDADRWRRVWVFLHVKSDSTRTDIDNPDDTGDQVDGR